MEPCMGYAQEKPTWDRSLRTTSMTKERRGSEKAEGGLGYSTWLLVPFLPSSDAPHSGRHDL